METLWQVHPLFTNRSTQMHHSGVEFPTYAFPDLGSDSQINNQQHENKLYADISVRCCYTKRKRGSLSQRHQALVYKRWISSKHTSIYWGVQSARLCLGTRKASWEKGVRVKCQCPAQWVVEAPGLESPEAVSNGTGVSYSSLKEATWHTDWEMRMRDGPLRA